MKLFSRLGTNTLSLVFFSIFFSLSLIFVTESMALNNASLNGTYGYVVKGSLFTGLDGNGGFGQNDEEFVQYGDIVFDGAGGCTDLGPTENRITRSILETPGLSNTFTTGHVETVSSAIPCTYTVSLDGPMTITFAPGTPDEITLAGMLSGDRGTLLFHHVSDIPNDVLGTLVVTAVKKGVGMSNASLNGSFAVAGRWSGFEGADINGGFGGNDTEGLRREEFTFDGAGGCTNSVIAEDFLTRSIGEIAHSNTFTTFMPQAPPHQPPVPTMLQVTAPLQ